MSDLSLIQELLKLLHDSDVGSIEIKRGWFSTTVRVSKHHQPVVGAVVDGPRPAAPVEAAPNPPPAGVVQAAAPAATLVDIKSPMVGTFYRSPEPGAEPYVDTGSRVKPGQAVCVIEAMKIMNELEAEVAGVVKDVLVEDAQPVEFGQVLFRVDPHG